MSDDLRRLSPADREKVNVLITKLLCGYGPDDPLWHTVDHVGALLDENDRLRALGEKVNTIRNSIVGFQRVGFSEHVYPLVAALDEAGFQGEGYEISRKNAGTLVARIAELEGLLRRARDRIAELEKW